MTGGGDLRRVGCETRFRRWCPVSGTVIRLASDVVPADELARRLRLSLPMMGKDAVRRMLLSVILDGDMPEDVGQALAEELGLEPKPAPVLAWLAECSFCGREVETFDQHDCVGEL